MGQTEAKHINVLAMLLCDAVAQDLSHHRLTLIGLIRGWSFGSFPRRLPDFCVYAAFTEVRGKVSIQVEILDSNENVIQRVEPMDVQSADEIEVVEAIAIFAGVKIPGPGHYFVRLLADGVYIVDRRVVITKTS